jgi:hypothetical protein
MSIKPGQKFRCHPWHARSRQVREDETGRIVTGSNESDLERFARHR